MKLKENQNNLRQIGDLVEYAFNKDYDVTKDINFLARYKHSEGYGIFHHDQLASYVMANNFKSRVLDNILKMSGVGYVASYPENRGRGDISRIMQELLLDQKDNGFAFSNLAPFSESFYRHFGYENTIYQKVYQFSSQAIRFFKPIKNGYLRRGRWSDDFVQKDVKKIYSDKLSNNEECNVVVREDWWWERMESYYPNRSFAIYYDENDKAQGYLIYQINKSTFLGREFIYKTPRAAQALLSFIASHSMSEERYKLIMPSNSLIEAFFSEQADLKIRQVPYMMSRIIDFKQVASAMKFVQDGEMTIEVKNDKQIPENNGKWHLAFKNGKMTCTKVEQGFADYCGDLTVWNQIMLGRLTIKEAVKLGKLLENNKKSLDFIKGESSFYDYF